MTNQPSSSDTPGTAPTNEPPRKSRLPALLALGLLVAALAVGAGVWLQGHRAEAAYKSRAAAFHAALTKVRAGLEANQPPDSLSRDWENARVKEKDWEDHLSDTDERKDLTEHLRTASIMYGNAVNEHQKTHGVGSAETQPTSEPTHDLQKLMTNGNLALDLAAQDLKK